MTSWESGGWIDWIPLVQNSLLTCMIAFVRHGLTKILSLSVQDGTPTRPLLPLLQEQALPQVEVQPWCPRPQSAFEPGYQG